MIAIAPRHSGSQPGGDPILARIARAVSSGAAPHDVLRDSRADVFIARAYMPSGSTVVVKLWNRPTLKGAIRRLTRTNAGYREWRSLDILHRAGLSVPRPLVYVRLDDPSCAHTEALVSEDLGQCVRTIDRIKSLLAANDRRSLRELEEGLINLTAGVIDAGIVDSDHRIENFTLAGGERLVRIDLEHGISVGSPMWRRRLGEMIGTLVGSYVFAVQPRLSHAESFAQRLIDRLGPPPSRVLHRAASVVEAMLRRQRTTVGIDSRLALAWS